MADTQIAIIGYSDEEFGNRASVKVKLRDVGDGTFAVASDPVLMAKMDQLIALLSNPLDVSIV